MGMFDYLVIDDNFLPEEFKGLNEGWQTKSLDCELNVININESGDLYIEERTWCNEYSEPYQPINIKKIDYSGDIIFYDFVSENWIEFKVTFLNGKLTKITQLNDL